MPPVTASGTRGNDDRLNDLILMVTMSTGVVRIIPKAVTSGTPYSKPKPLGCSAPSAVRGIRRLPSSARTVACRKPVPRATLNLIRRHELCPQRGKAHHPLINVLSVGPIPAAAVVFGGVAAAFRTSRPAIHNVAEN